MPNESSDKVKTSGFSNQASLLRQFGRFRESANPPTNGLSLVLSNLYASQRIDPSKETFLDKTEADIWKMTEKVAYLQDDLEKKVGSGGRLFPAFHDANMPYEARVTENGPSERLLTEIMDHTNHVLITYPIKPEKPNPCVKFKVKYEQSYLGKDPISPLGTNRCAYFNANRDKGEVKGNCKDVIHEAWKDLQEKAYFDGRPTLYGMALK